MNHQQYETWLFADEPLNPDQEQALEAHVITCASCEALQRAWLEVELEFAAAVQQAPVPGFVDRWQSRLAIEHAQSERRQSLVIFSFTTIGMAILLALMVAQWVLAYSTPAQFFLAVGGWFASLFSLTNASLEIIVTLIRTLPEVFLISVWVGFAGLGLLSALWIFSVHQFTFKRRVLT